MGKNALGEFEEVVLLTIIILQEEAYGVTIKNDIETRLKRSVSLGAMRTALDRLEAKGYVTSTFGEATAVRGGKRKKFFQITAAGKAELQKSKASRQTLWDAVAAVNFKLDTSS